MDKKGVIKIIFCIVGLLVLTWGIGFATLIGMLMCAFIGSTYLPWSVLGVGLGAGIYMWLVVFWKSKRKKINMIALIYIAVIGLATGGIAIKNAIVDSIPIVGDGSLILSEYIPFGDNTKLVPLKEETKLKLTDNLPKVDGATALFPVYSAFVQAVYPQSDYSMYRDSSWRLEMSDKELEHKSKEIKDIGYLRCTKTNEAYERLINKEADIIFVSGPSEQQLKMAEDAGVKMKLTPIGREAFVFFVNSKNKVNGLTVEQVQKIYSGEITNWSELGGKTENIRAFQRPENSGSQTSLQKLMKGKILMRPIKEDVVDGMGGIIAKTANYKNYKNAIGYSFRYFSTEMVKNNQIKHLALNGVIPTKDTIRDGSYPISSNFYAITLEGNDNPNVEKFIEWILGEQGQYIIEETGYVGI